jgi:hypothetical protein
MHRAINVPSIQLCSFWVERMSLISDSYLAIALAAALALSSLAPASISAYFFDEHITCPCRSLAHCSPRCPFVSGAFGIRYGVLNRVAVESSTIFLVIVRLSTQNGTYRER